VWALIVALPFTLAYGSKEELQRTVAQPDKDGQFLKNNTLISAFLD
jgi:hypothetical protein